MRWVIAAIILPVPVIHLWLHGLLVWWRKYPRLFYFFQLLLFSGSFLLVRELENISPTLLVPSQAVWRIGIILMILGVLAIIWSFMTLGPRRFFMWAALHPDLPVERETGGLFRFIPHPAYTGYLVVALGNLLSGGKFYLAGILAMLMILTPIVIWLEEEELTKRMS